MLWGRVKGGQVSLLADMIAGIVKLKTEEEVITAATEFFQECVTRGGFIEDVHDFVESMDMVCNPQAVEDLELRKECLVDSLTLVEVF